MGSGEDRQPIITARLGKVMFLHLSVGRSVHRVSVVKGGGVCGRHPLDPEADTTPDPEADTTPDPEADSPWTQRQTPPYTPPEVATEAGDTHPTGMLSCLQIFVALVTRSFRSAAAKKNKKTV